MLQVVNALNFIGHNWSRFRQLMDDILTVIAPLYKLVKVAVIQVINQICLKEICYDMDELSRSITFHQMYWSLLRHLETTTCFGDVTLELESTTTLEFGVYYVG